MAAAARRRPFVTFKWGSIESPKMVGSSLSIRFVMFRPNGEPLARARRPRAHAVRAGPARPEPDHARDRRPQVHTVTDGDSLQSISYANYGDATRWRTIAEANGIDNPLHLRRGTELSIPKLET